MGEGVPEITKTFASWDLGTCVGEKQGGDRR